MVELMTSCGRTHIFVLLFFAYLRRIRTSHNRGGPPLARSIDTGYFEMRRQQATSPLVTFARLYRLLARKELCEATWYENFLTIDVHEQIRSEQTGRFHV
jgi:hypothetical protein